MTPGGFIGFVLSLSQLLHHCRQGSRTGGQKRSQVQLREEILAKITGNLENKLLTFTSKQNQMELIIPFNKSDFTGSILVWRNSFFM
jgi:hypothetical protein